MSDSYLKHHGIKGMQWGVRRTVGQLGSSRISKGRRDDTAEKTNNKMKKAEIKSMSDVELRQKINRIQMEQQYQKLTGTDINRGKEVASKIFKAGTTIAAVTTTGLTIYNNAKKIKEIIEKTT